ncbi:MAG TPA: type I-E CRISPR-associated endoribonuclease Cas2e [Pseudonocardiaceae bacterium]|nr:type I-E CRISPR-associated endoribonuclease Cas2e [Pseudonocardiaceae bacterium]
MTVIVVAACPVGLRGHLTRWLLEIAPGVFVGKISARVRELMWQRVLDMVRTGRATMVYAADNEQGLAFEVHKHNWRPTDIDGITLMLRPATASPDSAEAPDSTTTPTLQTGWSKASKRRRFGSR